VSQSSQLGARVAVVLFLLLGGEACAAAYGCPDLCAKEADCRQDIGAIPSDEDACVAQCETLSAEDPAYAEAVAERAACYLEDSDATCESIVFGFACTVSGE